MATTSSNPTAGTAIGGQAGNGKGSKGFGLKALLAAFGCAAALAFGALHGTATPAASGWEGTMAPAAKGWEGEPGSWCVQVGRWFTCEPAAFVADQFASREDQRVPAQTAPTAKGWEGAPPSWCEQVGRVFVCTRAEGALPSARPADASVTAEYR